MAGGRRVRASGGYDIAPHGVRPLCQRLDVAFGNVRSEQSPVRRKARMKPRKRNDVADAAPAAANISLSPFPFFHFPHLTPATHTPTQTPIVLVRADIPVRRSASARTKGGRR